jgi:ribonuclease HI
MPPRPADVVAALAETLDPGQVMARFGLSRQELQDLLRQAAAACRPADGPWRLYVDGASRGNPGPAGAGAILYDPAGAVQRRGSRFLGRATNNVAEYQGLLLGLTLAREQGARRLDIRADSELMVRQLNGRYRVRHPGLLPLWQAAVQALEQFDAWSIAHVDRSLNQEADRLARQAVDQGGASGYNDT